MGFLQNFHLFIKYTKENTKNLVDMLPRLPTSNITVFETLMHIEPFIQKSYREAYKKYEDFKEVF